MKLKFICKTRPNEAKISINTLKITLKDGSVLCLDRDETDWLRTTTNEIIMWWDNCYLWSLNGQNIFGQEGYKITDEYSIEQFKELIEGATFEFFLEEDDIDEDYFITIKAVGIIE